jgi:hypothetical protein
MIRQTQTTQQVRITLTSASASAASAAPAAAAAPAGGGFGNPADIQAYRLQEDVAFRATREALDEFFRDNPQGLDVEARGREEIVHRLPEMIDQVAPETQQENYRKVGKLMSGTLFSLLCTAHDVTKGEDTK